MTKAKVKLGQTVFITGSGNNTVGLIETTVSKVGKKYFEVEQLKYRARFLVDTLEEEHSGRMLSGRNWKLYLSKQEYDDETERAEIGRRLRDWVNKSGIRHLTLNLEDLRTIDTIISKDMASRIAKTD
ncbi:MAG TPA: hypothetical protein VGD05_02255 [Pyrinomonadaceae bacterium]|jgi:hypothetical protein